MATRNGEKITELRVAECYELLDSLENVLSRYGRIGVDKDCDIWIPVEIDYIRDVYVVLRKAGLVTPPFVEDIRSVLRPLRFIWVVIIHVGSDDAEYDDRVLELTRSETVVLPDSALTEHYKQVFQ